MRALVMALSIASAARAADGFVAVPVGPSKIEFKFGHRGPRGEFVRAREYLFTSASAYYRGDLLLDCAIRRGETGRCSHKPTSMTWSYDAPYVVIKVRVAEIDVVECRALADAHGACSASGVTLYVEPMKARNVLNPGDEVSMPPIRVVTGSK